MREMERCRLLLIEPSAIVAHGLREILSQATDFEVLESLNDLTHCSERITLLEPDMVVMDPCVIDYSKRLAVRNLIPALQQVTLVAISSRLLDEASLRQYDTVLNLYDDPAQLVRKLRQALKSSAAQIETNEGGSELSTRENEILVAVVRGMTNKEIADLHSLSIHTVISHRKNISRKTGIRSVSGLTVYALLHNLIDQSAIE